MAQPKFSDLQGKTLAKVEQIGEDVLRFECDDGKKFQLYHSQDCCESVVIESVVGDFLDLVGTPILMAEEASSNDDPADIVKSKAEARAADPNGYHYDDDSQTWTFYKLRTIKGSVDIRWHGTSNGCYSESVDFEEVE